MHWRVKYFAQRVLSWVPCSGSLYRLAQQKVGRVRFVNARRELAEAEALVGALESVGETLVDKRTLEIGTGWTAVVPIWFWLRGQQSCHTYDLHRWLRPRVLRRVLVELAGSAGTSPQATALVPDRVTRLNAISRDSAGLNSLAEEFGIHYHAPADATRCSLPSGSVDVVFSKYVFGHIPVRVLIDFVGESMRVLKPGGVFVHLVDLKDQYSSEGGGLSPIHFLQYSEQEYRKFDTAFLYQNRLRASQLRAIIEKAGFRVLRWSANVSAAARAALPRLRIAEEFAGMSEDDLCTTSVRFVAQKPQDLCLGD